MTWRLGEIQHARAMCAWCERLMDGAGCTEVDYAAPHADDTACWECGVRPGGYHHPLCTAARAADGCDDQAYGHTHPAT